MSKPRKDRSTPSGSTPVDAEAATDGAADTGAAGRSASSWEPRSTVRSPTEEKAGSDATTATAGKGPAKTGSSATSTAAKGSAKKKEPAASRADAAEELARRTTAQKVRVSSGDNPVWWVPLMVGLMVLGLIWLVVTYLAQGSYPAPKLGVVWNLGIGFVLVMLGFLMTTRWK